MAVVSTAPVGLCRCLLVLYVTSIEHSACIVTGPSRSSRGTPEGGERDGSVSVSVSVSVVLVLVRWGVVVVGHTE